MLPAPIARLLQSSKATVVLTFALISLFALWRGLATWAQVESFLRWMGTALVASIAVEDAAGKLAGGKGNPPSP